MIIGPIETEVLKVEGTEKAINILVVEDNTADIQMLMLFLKKFKDSKQVETVQDGEAAIHYLFDQVPSADLVQFSTVIKRIEEFWISTVTLPRLRMVKEGDRNAGDP